MSLQELDGFFKAVSDGDIAKIEELLRKGVSVNARNALGQTPLHRAASSGRADIAEMLIKRGADVNAREGWLAQTPLHWAAINGHADVVKLLLENGADPSIKDKNGKTALDVAREGGHADVAEIIETFISGRRESIAESKERAGGESRAVRVTPLSILGVESSDLFVGKWGRIMVRVGGSGEASLSIEGDVDWLNPGRLELSGETVIEVPVKPRISGEVPIKVTVESSGKEGSKIIWLKVGEKHTRAEEVVKYRAYLAALEEMYRRGEVKEEVYKKLKEEYENKLKELESL
ncbi:MAG: ankyrin repeat domain-containing protein [Thermofilum sp.]|nr:ankyrin repeat domain-containing protein [Thermofilum sp.]